MSVVRWAMIEEAPDLSVECTHLPGKVYSLGTCPVNALMMSLPKWRLYYAFGVHSLISEGPTCCRTFREDTIEVVRESWLQDSATTDKQTRAGCRYGQMFPGRHLRGRERTRGTKSLLLTFPVTSSVSLRVLIILKSSWSLPSKDNSSCSPNFTCTSHTDTTLTEKLLIMMAKSDSASKSSSREETINAPHITLLFIQRSEVFYRLSELHIKIRSSSCSQKLYFGVCILHD